MRGGARKGLGSLQMSAVPGVLGNVIVCQTRLMRGGSIP